MSKVPVLSLKPEDIDDEITPDQLPSLAHSFVTLVLYVEEQFARCGTPASR